MKIRQVSGRLVLAMSLWSVCAAPLRAKDLNYGWPGSGRSDA